MSIPRKRRLLTGRRALMFLIALLMLSVTLNVALYRAVLTYYRQALSVRLNPLDLRSFDVSNRALGSPAHGSTRVVLVGDSRIAQWDPLPHVAHCEVINRGLSGHTTAQTLLRLNNDVLSLRPHIVVIEVGINDLKAIGVCPAGRKDIVNECIDNIRQTAELIRRNGAEAVILTIFPTGPIELFRRPVWSPDIVAALEDTNACLLGLARPGITVVDCSAILKTGMQPGGTFSAGALHLSPEGYLAVNTVLSPLLQSLVNRSRSHN